jgi:hypothetical protein
MKREMNKEWLPHIIAVGAFVVFIVLGLACASTPTTQIDLDANYRKYLQQPSGNERAIDSVGLRGNTSFVCRDASHSVTSAQQLGATYQLGGEYTSKSKAAEATAPSERHRHELILDQLVSTAKKQYPSETAIDIRSAKTAGHNPTNPRLEEYQARSSDGNYYTATRTVWDCVPIYVASVITTAPMPNPVSHSEKFALPRGATQSDVYTRAYNWLDRNKTSRRVVIESESNNPQRYNIKGTVTCAAKADQTYLITSEYTIDVFSTGVEINFAEPILRRTDPSLQRVGGPEKIFLQSIADATLAELVDFSTSLRSNITTQ